MLLFQLVLLCVIMAVRGPRLLGRHLRPIHDRPGHLKRKLYLYFVNRNEVRTQYALHLGVEAAGGIPFMVRKERWYHRYFKRVGLATEVGMRDAEFDRKYYVTTDFPHHLERIMADGPLLGHLHELMRMNVKVIHVSATRVWCVTDERDFEKPYLHYVPFFALLEKIGVAVRADAVRRTTNRRRILAVATCLGVHMAALVFGILGYIPVGDSAIDMIDDGPLVGAGIAIGLGLVVVWSGVILGLFRGSSWLGWVMADFWIWGVVGFMLSGTLWARHINITMRQPEPVVYNQRVLHKVCELRCRKDCGRRCTLKEDYAYYAEDCRPEMRATEAARHIARSEVCQSRAWFDYEVMAESWRPKGARAEGYRMTLDEAQFDTVKQGEVMRIPVHRGALSMEWVDVEAVGNGN